ncbi:LOW QUALITY PROTEIN: cytochrome P450 2G1-like [Emydura macquarii macquarii]|uniref:LOW QUALITY PROTEIN: cytochrome P450 2G1-like n=1 Tax=Emydura macquarii macquarii TaxID=1129001 RepID=UPI00352A8D5E
MQKAGSDLTWSKYILGWQWQTTLQKSATDQVTPHTMELAGAIAIFLGIYVCCLIVVAAWKKPSRYKNLPPGPTPLPLIGNFLQMKIGETLKSFEKLSEKYGPVFTVYFGSKPIVVLCGHEAVKEALVDQAEEFSGRALVPTVEKNFHDFGVVFANGERWRQLRRFSLTVLRNFGMGKKSIEERIQEEAQFLLETFRNTKAEPFDPTYFLSRAVSNVICSIVFGNRFDYEDKEFLSLLKMMNESFREISSRWSQFYDMYASFLKYFPGPHTKIYYILEDMRKFIERRVKENQATLDPSSPRDFIDCFLVQMEKEKQNPASEFNIKNLELTTLNLFFAGTETVSSTLRYGFLFLMKHPEVLEKLHEEIDRVIGQNRVPAIEDRSQMPYTDAVIHEIQRVSDLIPMDVPHTVIRDTQFRGYTIPKGTEIYPMLSTVLHDPKKFKNPESFNPGNFLEENGRFQKNDAFVPFSSGKRICLGEALARMELFLFFTTILQSFTLKPLMAPKDIDTTPLETGFANIPPFYQLCIVPR